ncbi:hypothetical protein DOK78_002486 [Enterococcus sp. DIV2402]|uniref:Uncharacterized protein n=1 Tax=Candidatus Enterococcus lowellii TaxID=2230877 RepID=A0ABZ2SPZ2_9ENTE|nr:hypothetical protein [Enterococcus sp. DIV2402]MBO0463395.1 hypothetical protein [Enterococcus sp. DIV2402]
MDITERLANFPEAVTNALSDNFIFLVDANKIQHYPARDWTKEEVLASLTERLGSEYTLKEWQNTVLAINKTRDLLAIIPKYQYINQLK